MQKYTFSVVSTGVYRLIFTKLSVNIELLLGFGTVYSDFDGSVRLRDVAMVTDLRRMSTKIDTPHLHPVNWHLTMVFPPPNAIFSKTRQFSGQNHIIIIRISPVNDH